MDWKARLQSFISITRKPFFVWVVFFGFLLFNANKFSIDHAFGYDAAVKLLQTQSLLESDFSSEQYHYPASDIDPDYSFFPIGGFYYVNVNGRHLGQYPVAFSLLSAPFWELGGAEGLYLINVLSLIGIFLLLQKKWHLSNPVMLLAILGTPYMVYAFEYAEHLLFFLMAAAGTTYYFKARGSLESFLGGLVLGLSVWLRLEVLPYILVLALAILMVRGLDNFRGHLLQNNVIFSTGVILGFLSFVLFNYYDYGALLGPRFLNNDPTENVSLLRKVTQVFVLFFGGFRKLGFFGYTPWFLVAVVAGLLWNRYGVRKNSTSSDVVILFWTGVIFLPFASVIAHTEAQYNWGPRYLGLALFPLLVVSDDIYHAWKRRHSAGTPGRPTGETGGDGHTVAPGEPGDRREFLNALNIVFFTLLAFSTAMTIIGVKQLKNVANHMKTFEAIYNSVESDVRLFQDTQIVYFSGKDFLDKKILHAETPRDLRQLIPALHEKASGDVLVYYEFTGDRAQVRRQMSFPEPLQWLERFLVSITDIPTYEGITQTQKVEYRSMLDRNFKHLDAKEFPDLKIHRYRIPESD